MRDLNDLAFFAAVVEHGGFAAAGRALGIPKSRLSRRGPRWRTILACAYCNAPPVASP